MLEPRPGPRLQHRARGHRRLGAAVADPAVLDPRLRETVILRVAYLSHSAYELHHHVPLGRTAGLSEADLDRAASIAVANPYWNPRPFDQSAIRSLLQDAWEGRRPAH